MRILEPDLELTLAEVISRIPERVLGRRRKQCQGPKGVRGIQEALGYVGQSSALLRGLGNQYY